MLYLASGILTLIAAARWSWVNCNKWGGGIGGLEVNNVVPNIRCLFDSILNYVPVVNQYHGDENHDQYMTEVSRSSIPEPGSSLISVVKIWMYGC